MLTKKNFFTLWIAGILGTFAVIPYLFSLQGDILRGSGIPVPQIILLSTLQTAVMLGICIFIGLWLMKGTSLKLIPTEKFISVSVGLGIASTIIIYLADLIFVRFIPNPSTSEITIPIWKGFLASFYGGITEEILLRLFFLTTIVWIFSKFTRKNASENSVMMWISIVIASVFFGIAHLPTVAALAPVTFIVVLRIILLNVIAGIAFGWLYWKKGLLAAMTAHFSADIMLHVILAHLI